MSQVQQLYQLQQIDTEIRQKKQRLGDVLKAQKETNVLLAARTRLDTAETQLRTWQAKRQELDRELQSLKDKTKRSEQRLYSGNVKNPKELTDLEKEIASLNRRRASLEDEILEAMIVIEDAESEHAAAAEALESVKNEWEHSQAALKQEQNELALRLHSLNGKRQAQLERISADSLAEYDSISRQKGGVAVAKINNGICTGCRINVITQTEKEAREGKKVYCTSCGRILVV